MLRTTTAPENRRGVTLLMTLSALTVLALIGFLALNVARDQAEVARIRGNPSGSAADLPLPTDGLVEFNAFLAYLIYDGPDDGAGLANGIRGHSLMATMYGRPRPVNPADPTQGMIYPVVPYNGPGTFGALTEQVTVGASTFNRPMLVNHRLFPNQPVYDPEWSQSRGAYSAGTAVAPTGSGAGQVYYGKNAPYTYPDLNNFFLAVVSPATGEVLVPSFHRPNAFGDLNPANAAKWANPAFALQTPRPTKAFHPNFPPVPANPDTPSTTYTGDVQNLPGGFAFLTGAGNVGTATQKNDSIWIDIGLSPITLPSGKRLKPLVAPLVLDLDGRLNLSIHGNLLNNGAHASGDGMGPWEISLEKALGRSGTVPLGIAEAQALVKARGTALATRSGRLMRAYYERYGTAAPTELPQYSQVSWTGFRNINPFQLPGFYNGTTYNRLFNDAPFYDNTPGPAPNLSYDYTNNPANYLGHPSLFNPHEWLGSAINAGAIPAAYPFSDTKILTSRYAPTRGAADQLSFALLAPNTLRGQIGAAGTPAFNTQNNYRADPSHPNRLLFTTYSGTNDFGVLMPGATQASSPYASLPPLDLNRPLADYRANTALPLSDTNVGNAVQAQTDRQQFAMDIFARLVAATGAQGATVNPQTGVVTITATPGGTPVPSPYDQLRRLAQLAANIVDYIDNDDVSTVFQWNTAANLAQGDAFVFGVEKPRLVINEVYSEVTNDPSDPAFTDATQNTGASKDAHVRFWVELHNPTAIPYSAAGVATHPLGTGAVALRTSTPTVIPYRIDIVRDLKGGAGTSVTNLLRSLPPTTGSEANVTGDNGGFPPDVVFDFTVAAAGQSVAPANGTSPAASFALCSANVPKPPAGSPDFNPTFAGAIQGTAPPAAIGGSTTALSYPLPLKTAYANNTLEPTLGNHVVTLRRLANPYLPEDKVTNPYISVDVLTYVRTADRIKLADGMTPKAPRQAKPTDANGYESETSPAAGTQDLRPQSFGKVQPYTAWSGLNAWTPAAQPTFPNSLVLFQNPDANGTGSGGGTDNVRHTFGRANYRLAALPTNPTYTGAPGLAGGETLMAPFDWLTHLDRPLVNQLELLHATAGKPHELTTNFIRGGAALVKEGHAIYRTVTQTTGGDQYYRALELLRVQPRVHQAALGGRVPGRLNINTIQDLRVWRALFDAQGYNGFDEPGFVDGLWTSLIGSRTPNMVQKTDAQGNNYICPVPGLTGTVYEGGTDRPFLPFGVAEVAAGGATFPAGANIDDTLLRRPSGGGPPMLAVTDPTTLFPVEPSYKAAEAARKILNNVTTVSNTYGVWVTVAYFEIEPGSEASPPAGWPTLANLPAGTPPSKAVPWHGRYGREYYREVPGDTRHRFFSLVDRTHVGLDPTSYLAYQLSPTSPPVHATTTPYFTTIEANARATTNTLTFSAVQQGGNVFVYTNGTPVPVGNMLVVGVGATREVVGVQSVGAYDAVNGTVTVTLNSPFQYNHWTGESVSNVVTGNPGPQTGFDVNLDKYKAVVPYWTRVQ